MDYARPALADRLAAEYALGTLRGPARRRYETLLAAHPQLRQSTVDWQRRLEPLTASETAQEPPAKIWRAIDQRLFGNASSNNAALPWWRRLVLWQGLTASSAVAAVALAVALAVPRPQAPPLVIVMGGEAGPASFVASISGDGGSVVLKPVNGVTVQAQRVLELWSVPANGAPRSLGVVASDRATTVLRVHLLQNTEALAVSVEPTGGSPTGQPTGPIVSVGKLRT